MKFSLFIIMILLCIVCVKNLLLGSFLGATLRSFFTLLQKILLWMFYW